jgi:hypothetical protein
VISFSAINYESDRKIQTNVILESNTLQDVLHHKQILHKIATDLQVKQMDDFYNLVSTNVTLFHSFSNLQDFKNKGEVLLKHYKHPQVMLSTLYPDHDWLPWKFETAPNHFWDDIQNQRKFLIWAEKQLNVKEPADWYKVTFKVTIYGNEY